MNEHSEKQLDTNGSKSNRSRWKGFRKFAAGPIPTLAILLAAIWMWTLGPGYENVRGRLAEDNTVLVYTQTTCAPCWRLKLRLATAGVPYEEVVLDKDEQGLRNFYRMLAANQVKGGVGTPTVRVNDSLLLNNPDFSAILAELKYRD